MNSQESHESEAELIRSAQQGVPDALERIYERYSGRVYALCLRMVGNTADAEDLTQEAFLQVFRKIGTFRGESAFSTWLHRLAFNVVLMRLRRRNVIEISLDEALDPEDDTLQVPREFGRIDTRLCGSVDRVNLERAVSQLPPGYRTAFVLHDVLGYEHNQIAAILDCSIGNSKSQLHKARLKLRSLLLTGSYEPPRAREGERSRITKSRPALRVRAAAI